MRKATSTACARILTSAQSIALLREKEQKKTNEKKEKEKKKLERQRKKIEKEQEKERKVKEREARQAEKKKKTKGQRKENKKPKRGSPRGESSGDQNVCPVCYGCYEDDIQAEWIQCINSACGSWFHVDCLDVKDSLYVCADCLQLFM